MSEELVKSIATKAGISHDEANKFINAFSEIIVEAINKGEKVTLDDFGSFTPDKVNGELAVRFEPDEKFLKSLE